MHRRQNFIVVPDLAHNLLRSRNVNLLVFADCSDLHYVRIPTPNKEVRVRISVLRLISWSKVFRVRLTRHGLGQYSVIDHYHFQFKVFRPVPIWIYITHGFKQCYEINERTNMHIGRKRPTKVWQEVGYEAIIDALLLPRRLQEQERNFLTFDK